VLTGKNKSRSKEFERKKTLLSKVEPFCDPIEHGLSKHLLPVADILTKTERDSMPATRHTIGILLYSLAAC
jgi:hypothetical protein